MKTTRLLSLLLVLLFSISAVACGNTPETETENAKSELDIPGADYGEELSLLTYGKYDNYYSEEREGNVVSEAVYDREERLAEHTVPVLDDNLYMIPWLTQANTAKSMASYVQDYESGSNKATAKLLKMIDKIG